MKTCMSTSYQPYAPEQDLLLPQSLQEWLPAGHLAHYINDTIDSLDLSAFFKRYEGGGSRNQPFHPAMMVKVLVYGYATGVFSSRKMARKLHEDVAFRVLAAGNFPKHRTLCDFRALHLRELAALFAQVVQLAGECELVKLGTIAMDVICLSAPIRLLVHQLSPWQMLVLTCSFLIATDITISIGPQFLSFYASHIGQCFFPMKSDLTEIFAVRDSHLFLLLQQLLRIRQKVDTFMH